ncbi:hypothetical protein FJQ98_04810 [Lysinibacillus agricola]|uniref:Uncharacterized protein n=1 Tax=Lysinibacillus agricola TaxID=2590012 RepID=A0ABX7AUA6_9BACI|nr:MULTISPECIES: hypothetical protein [Lysinibacillus]KOS62509.1 hypothetical protein AN161_13020 [Lysinibacillus sp. FJAT-14222]QQP13386.1 hypothetical protein FJQ98_04810 [Lysinibacillus agricola]
MRYFVLHQKLWMTFAKTYANSYKLLAWRLGESVTDWWCASFEAEHLSLAWFYETLITYVLLKWLHTHIKSKIIKCEKLFFAAVVRLLLLDHLSLLNRYKSEKLKETG